MSKTKSSQSPYVKYNKVPHRYSAEYEEWKTAAKAGNDAGRVARAARIHDRKFRLYSEQ